MCNVRQWVEEQRFFTSVGARDGQPVGDAAQVQCEVGKTREASGLAIKVAEVELPAGHLATGVFAHQAVEPALDATGEAKVRGVERQNERGIDEARIEPVGQDELEAQRAPFPIRALGPLVDPREAMQAPLANLADRSRDAGRLQSIECRTQALIVTRRCSATGEGQDFVRSGGEASRGRDAGVARLDDLARRKDRYVGIPDGGKTVLERAFDAYRYRPDAVVNRLYAPRLGE